MIYNYETYTSDTISPGNFDRLEAFINSQLDTAHPALTNMTWDPNGGFLYNVANQLRWRRDQGNIYAVIYDGNIVAISCVEYPENTSSWAIGGIRTWIAPANRKTHLPSYVLDKQIDWARARNCNFMLLTFNEYNKAAHTTVVKGYESKAGWSNWWTDCLAVPDPVIIRTVPQWCVIKPVLCTNNATNLQALKQWQECP